MTNAMKRKALRAIEESRNVAYELPVNNGFHHYGENYRVFEFEPNKFKLFRCSKTSIIDTYIETFTI